MCFIAVQIVQEQERVNGGTCAHHTFPTGGERERERERERENTVEICSIQVNPKLLHKKDRGRPTAEQEEGDDEKE